MKLTADGPTLEQIIAWAQQRAQAQGLAIDAMRKIQSTYDGELVIPLPEMDRMEDPAVANIIAEGIDQLAGRIASTTPNIYYPPVRPGIQASELKARTRIRASQGWLQFNKYGNRQRRRASQLIAYGFSPYSVTYSAKWGAPEWQYRDPLNTFPLVTNDPDEMQPPNVIYKFQRSYGYLKNRYPEEMAGVETGHEPGDGDQFDLIEYNDEQVTVLAVLGVKTASYTQSTKGAYAELLRSPNRAGICLGVMAGRIGLSRTRGQFDGAVGIYKAQARMTALQIIAIEKGIFPAVVLTSHPGQQARLLSPAMHDGRTGIPNTVVNGEMSYLEIPQSQAAQQLGHDLERAARVTSGIAPEMGGECADEQTQILTDQGWKSHHEVEAGTTVLTLNHTTGLSEWQPVLKMNRYDGVAGKQMVEMESLRYSALTTLNHRWPVVSRYNMRKWKTASEMTPDDRIPVAAYNANRPVDAKYSDALVEAVAWFWTEGTFWSGAGSIAQSRTVNDAKCERIAACLNNLFGPPTTKFPRQGRAHDYVPRWRESEQSKTGVVDFRLSVAALAVIQEHVAGKEKIVSYDFLNALTQAQLELFVHVSMLGDNCGTYKLGQKSQERAERFAYACILAGSGVSYTTRTRHESRDGFRPGEYVTYMVTMKRGGWFKPAENALASPESASFRQVTHDGMVWCPTTENASWMARRNGSVYFTGNSQSNVRTGKRGDSILSAVIDVPIQAAQEMLAESLHEELRRGVALIKAYGPNRKVSLYVGRDKNPTVYTPSVDFENDNCTVTYAMAGADANGIMVAVGQRIGLGTMSKQSAMEVDPMVDDVMLEQERIDVENLVSNLQASLDQQAQAGTITPNDMALIVKYRMQGETLVDAVIKVHEQAQQRQATQAPPPGDGQVGAPEAQPGLAIPGQGAEQPSIAPPSQSAVNLSALLRTNSKPAQLAASAAGRPELGG